MEETSLAEFNLKLDDAGLAFQVPVPTRPMLLRELLPALFEFNRQLLAHAVAREEAAGRRISCRAGCGACCRQLVPISGIEAGIVRETIESLPPARAAGVRVRFTAGVERLKQAGLHDRLQARASLREPGQVRDLGLDYFKAGVACPFLVDESCSIYEVRPMKCREYLVTSPASNCADPSPEGVDLLALPGSFLRVLLALEQWSTGKEPSWLPLILLLEDGPVEPPVRLPGTTWFERFLVEFARLPPATATLKPPAG